ncbi:deoxyhypusine synthase-like [Convolutriloba macropyga]|uniref:deoxyhypusine synthase-like n=1 Tax=Convolutriloba macropyga TaxID=536237 RepID=UPI003F526443
MSNSNFDGKLPPEFWDLASVKDVTIPKELSKPVVGYDFAKCDGAVDYDSLLTEYASSTGLQATFFGKAIEEVNKMINWKLDGELTEDDLKLQSEITIENWKPTPCTIFLSYTSNIVTAGTREIIRYLVQHKMVDCLVSTGGGIEEDFMKCMAPLVVGEFTLKGSELFDQAVFRNGNVLLSDGAYGRFENWFIPILDKMLEEEKEQGTLWTPSKLIHRMGKEINDPKSIYYWAYKNNIPVFSPGITDGAIGDHLFLHSFKHDGRTITLDVASDVRKITMLAIRSSNTAALCLGAGVSKHHVLNANAWRLGLDLCVLINTAQEFDGCDSGARPDEGVSWGKIKAGVHAVKLFSDVSLVLPLLVSQTFFKRQEEFSNKLCAE